MSDLEELLSDIKGRLSQATEGPWEINLDGDIQGRRKGRKRDPEMEPIVGCLDMPEDNDFTAHARTDIPALVKALEAVLEATSKRHGPEVSQQYETAMESIEDIITEALGCVVH